MEEVDNVDLKMNILKFHESNNEHPTRKSTERKIKLVMYFVLRCGDI